MGVEAGNSKAIIRFTSENEHLKKCSISLAIKETQRKTTMRYRYTPVRMTEMKKIDRSKYWCIFEDVGKLELSHIAGGHLK